MKLLADEIEIILIRYGLAVHPSWGFSKEQVYEAVWKEPEDKCGSAVVKNLRKGFAPRKHGSAP